MTSRHFGRWKQVMRCAGLRHKKQWRPRRLSFLVPDPSPARYARRLVIPGFAARATSVTTTKTRGFKSQYWVAFFEPLIRKRFNLFETVLINPFKFAVSVAFRKKSVQGNETSATWFIVSLSSRVLVETVKRSFCVEQRVGDLVSKDTVCCVGG